MKSPSVKVHICIYDRRFPKEGAINFLGRGYWKGDGNRQRTLSQSQKSEQEEKEEGGLPTAGTVHAKAGRSPNVKLSDHCNHSGQVRPETPLGATSWRT